MHNLLNLSFDLPALRARAASRVAARCTTTRSCAPRAGSACIARVARVPRDRPGAVRAVFPGLAVSRAVARRPACTARARRARSDGWRRRSADRAPCDRGSRRGAGPHGPAVSTRDIERRLAAARAAFAEFDLVVAPSASLAREFARSALPKNTWSSPTTASPRSPAAANAPIRRPLRDRLRGHAGLAQRRRRADRRGPASASRSRRGSRSSATRRCSRTTPPRSSSARTVCRCVSWAASSTMACRGLFAQIDVLVVASRWLENSPLVIHEAFMAGVPVVGAAIGGIADLLGRRAARHPGPARRPGRAGRGACSAVDDPSAPATSSRACAPPVKTIEQDAAEWRSATRHRRRTRRRGGHRLVTPEVSIVVPTRNGAATLPALLDAIGVQTDPAPRELIVVDSGSTDGTLACCRPRPTTSSKSRRAVQPRHVAQPRRRARFGPLVVLTVQDALPLSARLADPPARAAAHDERRGRRLRAPGAASRRQRRDARPARRWVASQTAPRVTPLDLATFARLAPPDRLRRCAFDNVCAAIRRSVWETIPFQATPIAEDLEWSRNVLLAGHAIAYAPRGRRRALPRPRAHGTSWRAPGSCTSNCNGCSAFARCPRERAGTEHRHDSCGPSAAFAASGVPVRLGSVAARDGPGRRLAARSVPRRLDRADGRPHWRPRGV